MRNSEGTPAKSKAPNKLAPLDVNGVTAVTIGTVFWIVALVVLLLNRNWLISEGKNHWVWIAISGVVLGLLGYRYTTQRAKRSVKPENLEQKSLIQDFE